MRRIVPATVTTMKLKPRLLPSLLLAAALVPAVACAELAVTIGDVNMRAGPDTSYPRVATLGRGVTVDVVGCVEGWQWCDVIVGPNRGFVAASYLSYGRPSYSGAPVVIAQGGPTLGIPLIAFSIGNYWDSYYRGRPWWNDRERWYAHRVAPAPCGRARAATRGATTTGATANRIATTGTATTTAAMQAAASATATATRRAPFPVRTHAPRAASGSARAATGPTTPRIRTSSSDASTAGAPRTRQRAGSRKRARLMSSLFVEYTTSATSPATARNGYP